MKSTVHIDQSLRLSSAFATGWLTRCRLILIKYCQLMIHWHERARQRRHLGDLPDDRLRDIGVNRLEARREAEKPFWRP